MATGTDCVCDLTLALGEVVCGSLMGMLRTPVTKPGTAAEDDASRKGPFKTVEKSPGLRVYSFVSQY